MLARQTQFDGYRHRNHKRMEAWRYSSRASALGEWSGKQSLNNMDRNSRNIGEHMKNKLVRGIQSGDYGHATRVHNHKIGMDYIEVRMLDTYENVHTCTVPSFYMCYEVMDDVEE